MAFLLGEAQGDLPDAVLYYHATHASRSPSPSRRTDLHVAEASSASVGICLRTSSVNSAPAWIGRESSGRESRLVHGGETARSWRAFA